MNDIQKDLLPYNWALTKICNLVSINPSLDKSNLSQELEVSFIPMSDVQAETGNFNDNKVIKIKNSKNGYAAFTNGDIIFAKITPCMENGKIAIVNSLKNGIGLGSTEFHVLRPSLFVNVNYLYYLISSKIFRRIAEHYMTGAVGQRRVTKNFLSEYEIPFPPLYEQHKIVSKIEELFSELDNATKSLKKAREQLKTYRQSVLKHAFEGKLTEEWRNRQKETSNPPESAELLLVRIKQEREELYQKQLAEWKKACDQTEAEGKKKPTKPKKPKDLSPLTEEELADLPELPEGWSWCKLANLANSITKGASPKWQGINYVHDPCQVLFITSENVRNNFIDITNPKYLEHSFNKKQPNSKLQHGDILLNIVGASIGRAAVYALNQNANINQAVSLIRPTLYFYSKFLSIFLNSSFAIRFYTSNIVDVARANLSLADVSNIPIPICSKPEINIIISEIESRLSVCDQLEKSIEDSLNTTEALRQSILKKAFSGELTKEWREENPELISGENSAEKLLERITAEKKRMGSRKAAKYAT